MNVSPSLDPTNLLLGLAWLGELDRRQIERLWFVDRSQSTVEKTLSRLHDEGLLTRRAWSIRDKQRGVTVPQLVRWSLTPKGRAQVKSSAQYPSKPAQVRQQRLIPHDLRTTEAIVRLIELGRQSSSCTPAAPRRSSDASTELPTRTRHSHAREPSRWTRA
jgi:DNA-binding PadR family transcriptional regulator